MGLNPYLPISADLSNDGEQFGVPNCLLDIGKEVLELLLGDFLVAISLMLQEGILWAKAKVTFYINKFLNWLGFAEYDPVSGTIKFVTDGLFGVGSFGFLDAIGNFLGNVSALVEIYEDLADQFNALDNCIQKFKKKEEELGGSSEGNSTNREMSLEEKVAFKQVEFAVDFINRANDQLDLINQVLNERGDEEPDLDQMGEEPIFRLTYGPPQSIDGQLLLSVDGLYFDSQNREYEDGSIPSVDDIGFVPDRNKWKMDHAPSLGGKGTVVTVKDLNNYVDTLLDVEKIDDSAELQNYYDQDHLIQVLRGNKAKVVTDLDDKKQELIDSGYATSSAIYMNLQQQIFSEIELYDVKIRRRKKQIELAVKSTDLFGLETVFEPGAVPVNDFSYLSNIHLKVALEKQRKLSFDHGEVSGVVLPVRPIFSISENTDNLVNLAPIEVTKTGVGSMTEVYAVSSTLKPVLSVHDPIVTDSLVSVYNFIDPDVQGPNTSTFNLTNCNDDADYNAQLVGASTKTVFSKGLGLARLDGIARYGYDETSEFPQVSSVGSYVKLKSSQRFQDLMYNTKGCTFDNWLYMPGLGDARNTYEVNGGDLSTAVLDVDSNDTAAWTDFNYYKVLVSNENVGKDLGIEGSTVTINNSSDVVRGFVMGFTRDPLFTKNSNAAAGSDTDIGSTHGYDTGNTTSATSFFLAPTQSYSSSGASFIRRSKSNPGISTYYGMTVDISSTTSSGYKLQDCSGQFVHLSVALDAAEDQVRIYLNSELLATDTLSNAFGVSPTHPLRVPTFKSDDSFEYTEVSSGLTTVFNSGPYNDEYFTPWIIGGGWTDGHPVDMSTSSGGFMGSNYGLYSGLTGYVTSFKIYDKPLSKAEVLKNYNAHKEFLGNIKL